MKWILNRKTIFNTTTATIMASWSNGRHFKEPDFIEETLYRSSCGGFYLVGNHITGRTSGDSPSDRCRRLSVAQVIRWCRRRGQESAVAPYLSRQLRHA